MVSGLTPELSRAAARHWRWFNHSASAEAAKRARLERIVRPVPAVLLTKQLASPEPATDNCFSCERQTQKRSAGALAGTEFVARINSLGEAREQQRQLGLRLVDRHLFLDRSNAELSRTDLRRCESENVQHLHDAAKRCRLERHVMQRRKWAKQHG